MKVPVSVCCEVCGQVNTFMSTATFDLPDVSCPCGAKIFGVGDVPIGPGLLARAQYERTNAQDFSLAIVIAAMALDCEMSRLYVKWRRIDGLQDPTGVPDDETLEKEIRDMRGGAVGKLDRVAELLVDSETGQFVSEATTLSTWRPAGLTKKTYVQDLQEKLFRPRNRILHFGFLAFDDAAAKCAISAAVDGIYVCSAMDHVRRMRLEQSFRKNDPHENR